MGAKLLENLTRRSLKVAKTIPFDERHVTFICRKNEVVAVGRNSKIKTHPINKKFGFAYPYRHSETDALLRFPFPLKELRHYTLYNFRVNGGGRLLLAKPCFSCHNMLAQLGLRKLWYTTETGDFLQLRMV